MYYCWGLTKEILVDQLKVEKTLVDQLTDKTKTGSISSFQIFVMPKPNFLCLKLV